MTNEKIKKELEWYEKADKKRHSQAHLFAHNNVKKKIAPLLKKLGGENKRFLIAGIGCGAEVPFVQEVSKNLIGFDISFKALKQCAESYQIPLVVTNCSNLHFKENNFDFVLTIGLLHHLIGQGDLESYLTQLRKSLRKGGYLVAIEPNLFHPSGFLMTILQKIKPGITGLVPHEVALSPLSLKAKFKKVGFKEIKIEAASYVYNRFPLWLSRFIAKSEDKIRERWPFKFFGWFSIIYGKI